MRSLWRFILPLLILVPMSAAGEETVVISQAVRQALAHNHLVQAAGHERAAAVAGVAASRASFLPRIAFEESASLTNSPTRAFMMQLDQARFSLNGDLNHPATTGDFLTSLTLEQPLFDRRLTAGLALARKDQELADLALARRREDVALRTILAYLEVQQSKRQLAVAEEAVRSAREHERLAAVRTAAGAGLLSDELRARTFVSEMEQQVIAAGNRVQLAKLRLARQAGRPPGERLDIGEEYRTPVVAANQAAFVEQAFANRPELRASAGEVERNELGVRLARSVYWPTLRGHAGYQLHDRDVPFGRDNDAWVVGATLRWELFDGWQRCAETDQAKARQQAAVAYLADQRQEVALAVAESYLGREELGKRLEVARHAELAAAEGVRLLNRRYENSVALMVELLDAQTSLNRARSQVAETEAAYAMATVRLYHAAGLLLKEVMP